MCVQFLTTQTLVPLILFINWTSDPSHTTHSLKGFSCQILALFVVNIITQTIISGCLSEIRKHHETLFIPILHEKHLSQKQNTRGVVRPVCRVWECNGVMVIVLSNNEGMACHISLCIERSISCRVLGYKLYLMSGWNFWHNWEEFTSVLFISFY